MGLPGNGRGFPNDCGDFGAPEATRNHNNAAKGPQCFVMDSDACWDESFLSKRGEMLPG